jgi:K+-sensing histidine kinase KdpD
VTVSVDIEDRKRAQTRDAYLSATTARLVSPLDSTDILMEMARLAVPTLADVCAIGLFNDTARTVRIETALAHEDDRRYVEEVHLRGWREAPGSSSTIGGMIAAGRTLFVRDFSQQWIEACATDETQKEAALILAPGSIICVPLIARGETFGMATFAVNRSGRRYSEEDLAVIEEAAERLSIALENRQLYDNLRETAKELTRANQAKDEFLGLVSHELKTPITTILGNAEVLSRRFAELDEPSRAGALSDIRSEAERLHRIIDNLLVLARLEQGMSIEREPVLLRRIVEAVVTAHSRAFPSREVDVRWNVAPTPVLASPQYLEQTLRNLIGNAEKYSPPDRPIEIEGHREGDCIVISVLDQGPGIGEDEIDAVFTPFYRSNSTSQLAPGVGIGLAVCKRLIEAQDGSVWAARRQEGGSIFSFSLPVVTDDG